jgi:exopolyphosphatase/pppGpp-phosphohydrolase
MEQNQDIREMLRKYKITANDLLRYLPNFSHTTRIYEELAKPLSEERKKVYLLAIKKIKEEKKRLYDD